MDFKLETSVNTKGEFDICMEGGGDMIADLSNCGNRYQQEARAKRIVQCWNNHDKLVEALKIIKDAFWTDGESGQEKTDDLKNIAEQALAEAEKE